MVSKRMEARSGQNCNNKIARKSVFSATVVLFISLLCIHRQYNFFLRWLLIIFSNVNYFNVSLVEFFSRFYEWIFSLLLQSIFDCTANYFFLLVLRIIFSMALRIIFHGIVNLFFGLQYIAGLRLRGTGRVCDFLARWPFWKLYECFQKRMPRRSIMSEKEPKEDFSFSCMIWKESLVCARVKTFSGPRI